MLALHLIWIGGTLPLRCLENVHRLARMFEQQSSSFQSMTKDELPYMPLLWLDQLALHQTLAASVCDISLIDAENVPPAWLESAQLCLAAESSKLHWLQLYADSFNEIEFVFVPVLLVDELKKQLLQPWKNINPAWQHLRNLDQTWEGREFLQQTPNLAIVIQDHSMQDDAVFIFNYIWQLFEYVVKHWKKQGLLCMASDLLRLLVLVWKSGAYVDIGDIAARIKYLPTRKSARAQEHKFNAHYTIAIENDLIFCDDSSLIQAATIGVYVWSLTTIEAITHQHRTAPVIKINQLETLFLALNLLNQKFASVPHLADLYAVPNYQIVNYINRAYGSVHLVGDSQYLLSYFQNSNGREKLINHVAGFEGYQRLLAQMVPNCKDVWLKTAPIFGLDNYAPQLGWRTYGFGLLDQMILCGRRLGQAHPSHKKVQKELMGVSSKLGISQEQVEAAALRVWEVYELLEKANLGAVNFNQLIQAAIDRACIS